MRYDSYITFRPLFPRPKTIVYTPRETFMVVNRMPLIVPGNHDISTESEIPKFTAEHLKESAYEDWATGSRRLCYKYLYQEVLRSVVFVGKLVRSCVREFVNISVTWERRRSSGPAGACATRTGERRAQCPTSIQAATKNVREKSLERMLLALIASDWRRFAAYEHIF